MPVLTARTGLGHDRPTDARLRHVRSMAYSGRGHDCLGQSGCWPAGDLSPSAASICLAPFDADRHLAHHQRLRRGGSLKIQPFSPAQRARSLFSNLSEFFTFVNLVMNILSEFHDLCATGDPDQSARRSLSRHASDAAARSGAPLRAALCGSYGTTSSGPPN